MFPHLDHYHTKTGYVSWVCGPCRKEGTGLTWLSYSKWQRDCHPLLGHIFSRRLKTLQPEDILGNWWRSTVVVIHIKSRAIQPKLDRTDPVKSAASKSAIEYRSDTDSDLPCTWENIRPLANESVKHCTNGVVHTTRLTLAAFGCQSITYARSQCRLLDIGQ